MRIFKSWEKKLAWEAVKIFKTQPKLKKKIRIPEF